MKHIKLFEQFEDDPFGEEMSLDNRDFKIGDKVKCIKNNWKKELNLDQIYVVSYNNNNNYIRIDGEDFWWLKSRFIKV